MSRNSRYQPAVSRNTDENISEDHWLKQFESQLQKGAVQPKNQVSLLEQITSVMNNSRSKYPSVQAAVDDMMHRSGLTSYLKTKTSTPNDQAKIASDQNNDFDKTVPVEPKQSSDTPAIFRSNPNIQKTLRNYINTTRGNLPVPAVIDKIRSIHRNDINDDKLWEDDDLIRFVSRLNLEAKKNNPGNYTDYHNLAVGDRDNADIDPSNTDAFNSLMPAKM